MGNSCAKGETAAGRGGRGKGQVDAREIERAIHETRRAMDRVKSDRLSPDGKEIVNRVYGLPNPNPEIDPDGEKSRWYTKDNYSESYPEMYKQHYMLLADVEDFGEALGRLDTLLNKMKGYSKASPEAASLVKDCEQLRTLVGGLSKNFVMAWGNALRLVDQVESRSGEVKYMKSEGYSIRKECFTPFLIQYFPKEFTKAQINAHWDEVEANVAKEAKRMAAVTALSPEKKAKLYAAITANSKKLMSKYEKWLKSNKASAAPKGDGVDPGKMADKYVTITSSIFCGGGFAKSDVDRALVNGGEFGYHSGFFENRDDIGTWAITWTDEISKAYNALESTVNPSGYDHWEIFQMSPAANTGKVQADRFEISVPKYERYNPMNRVHQEARNRNHTYSGNDGEMVRLPEKKKVPHVVAEAICKTEGDVKFLIFPGGSCLDGIDLSKYKD